MADHQSRVAVPAAWMAPLEEAVRLMAAALVEEAAVTTPIREVDEFEISLLDDVAIGEVHGRFMGDPTPTDVITFDHGEILVGVETAWRQAGEFGEPTGRELLRYVVHGMLHLAGHDDREAADRRRMEQAQEAWVARLWASLGPRFQG